MLLTLSYKLRFTVCRSYKPLFLNNPLGSSVPWLCVVDFIAGIKKPQIIADLGFWCLSLTMTYSHMGRPHTTIGDTSFHYWVRDGIRWFQRSMVVKQFFLRSRFSLAWWSSSLIRHAIVALNLCVLQTFGSQFVLPKLFGCYMVKSHGQLVLVSSMPHSTYTPNLSTL